MKRLLAILLFVSASAAAQTPMDKNVGYLEIGGNGLFSANYERRVSEQWLARVGLSVGVVYSATDDDDDWIAVVPVMINHLSHPRGNHHFETGAGLTLVGGDTDEFDDLDGGVLGTATLGYRFQRPEGGFVFRAGFTPFFDGSTVYPLAGFSFGYAW